MKRRRRKRNKRRLKNNLSLKCYNDKRYDLITAKENYFLSDNPLNVLFYKNFRYRVEKINDDFYSVVSPNNKRVIITKELFTRVFI